MTKVKAKENGMAVSNEAVSKIENTNKVPLSELYGVSRSIFELSGSVPSLKGKIVYALTKNEAILESILTKADSRQQEIIKKYVELNKDGSFKLTEPTEEEIGNGARPEYIYKDEKDKVKAAKEVQDLMEEEVEVSFHKIWMNDFDNLDIPPARNQRIGLFIKYLVTEVRDLQMIQ